MVTFFLVHRSNALDCKVIAFGCTTGENDFFGRGVDDAGDLFAGKVYTFFGFPAIGMVTAGGVSEFFGEVGHHGFKNPRVGSGG